MNLRKLLTAFILLLTTAVANAQDLPNISDPRVRINLPTEKGDSLSLESLKGKVILLDFWASWCTPCRQANRGLVKLNSKYKGKGLVILSVSVDKNQKDWKKAISKDKMSWLHVNDPGGWDANVAVRWNVSVLPTTFLINKNGDVVSIDPEPKELEESVKKLLEE
jgi:thiol-disulfide isomerase/thioredoxin